MNNILLSLLFMNSYTKENYFLIIIFSLIVFLFEHYNILEHIEKYFTIFKKYKYEISFYGLKIYDKYGYKNKFYINASPGFIAINSLLIESLKKGELINSNNIEETIYTDENLPNLLFQIKTGHYVSLNNKLWNNIFFTITENVIESKDKHSENLVKLELKMCSNICNTQEMIEKTEKTFQQYEDKKSGKISEELYIFHYKNNKKEKFSYTKFQTNCNFKNLFFEEKENTLKFIDFFEKNKNWYKKYGRPYTLGICTYGPPGCGKTSFEKSLALYLNRHIIVVDFDKIQTETELNDIFFCEYIGPFKIPNNKRLYIFPDIDKTTDILYKDEFKDKDANLLLYKQLFKKQNFDKSSIEDDDTESMNNNSNYHNINLSQILNVIDGIMERDGQIFIMSANEPQKLDDALLRPGRIDNLIHFKEFTTDLLIEFIKRFFDEKYYSFENYQNFEKFITKNSEHLNYKYTPSKLFEICIESNYNLEKLQHLLVESKQQSL